MELEEDAESHNIVEGIFDKEINSLNELELKILCYELEELKPIQKLLYFIPFYAILMQQ